MFKFLGTSHEPIVVDSRLGGGRTLIAARDPRGLAVIEMDTCDQAHIDLLKRAIDLANSPEFSEPVEAEQSDPPADIPSDHSAE